MSELNDNIIKYRKQQNLSQEDLAQKLGLTRQSISKWERNESNPDLYNLKLLASQFQVSVDDLIGNNAENNKVKNGKRNFMTTLINRNISNAKSVTEFSKVKRSIIRYSIIVLIISFMIFLVGLFGFFKTGMINVNTPVFLQTTLVEENSFQAIGVYRVIVVGLTFFSVLLTSRAIEALKIGLSIIYNESAFSENPK